MYTCLATDFDNKVEKKIQSVIRAINKYGYSADYKVVSREIRELPVYKIDCISHEKVKIQTTLAEVVNYEFSMPDFKVGNYTPVAVIEHDVVLDSDVTNIIHPIDNFNDIPKSWWTIKGYCDDCNDKYSRKKTVMLLNNEDGSFRQIGTSCLKRYLGINCYNVISNFMTVDEIVEDDEIYIDFDYLPKQNNYIETVTLLAYVYASYKQTNGYIKDKTLDIALKLYKEKVEISNKYYDNARECIDFFNNIDRDLFENNTFYNNLKSAVTSKYCKLYSGFIACAPKSMVLLQDKLLRAEKLQEQANKSQYFGNTGDKFMRDFKVENVYGYDSQYGYVYINILKDAEDNIFVWKTTTTALEIGKEITAKATIKEHQEYNGIKQTVLTRLKLI